MDDNYVPSFSEELHELDMAEFARENTDNSIAEWDESDDDQEPNLKFIDDQVCVSDILAGE